MTSLRRIYAIGDVHGMLDRLQALHALISADLRRDPCADPLLVHLGDYVDRGPDSAGVVALLAAGPPIAGVETINLMGNHERTMLDALAGDEPAATDWIFGGGKAAMASWGIAPDSPQSEWAARIPSESLEFLRALRLSHHEGGFFLAHAGVRPGVKLADQAADDLLGIRAAFLYSDADFGAVVVHGHTAKAMPVLRHNRIGIDTGAVFGGKLTCAVLEADSVRFLQS